MTSYMISYYDIIYDFAIPQKNFAVPKKNLAIPKKKFGDTQKNSRSY